MIKKIFYIGLLLYNSCFLGMMREMPSATLSSLLNENFNILFSKGNLQDAQIIAIAEKHNYDPMPVSNLINLLYEPSSVLLIEGIQFGAVLEKKNEYKVAKNITVPIVIKGWNSDKSFDVYMRMIYDLANQRKLEKAGRSAEYVSNWPSLDERVIEPNRSMIKAIKEEISNGAKRIFVIFGIDHYSIPEAHELRNFLQNHLTYVLEQKEKRPQYNRVVQDTITSFGNNIKLDFEIAVLGHLNYGDDIIGRPLIKIRGLSNEDQYRKLAIIVKGTNAWDIAINDSVIDDQAMRLFMRVLKTLPLVAISILFSSISSLNMIKQLIDFAPVSLKQITIKDSKIVSESDFSIKDLIEYAKNRNIRFEIK